ncbi:3-oxoacyl-ACP reductase [Streptomyces cyaneogriseus subsp. noncyanogenus]|uniref:3-oxoacyl-ACP reductase n=1 Tax=Streptomyces cyaneogriseus subsp. noncyanogenus TaxID=477245 RepID=A0A0C5FYN1_9ACTN|nr:SDR family oxidoreductase [Streptomyces cyaneogriseus]AJP00999.1 3-oxoacyl-ACP reductase [Streptomyces cyaneogriseus subsp. noncyanogenus]
MDLGLQNRTALVCSSTGGLGEAVARALAAEGADTVVCGRRGERAARIAAELPSAVGVTADLRAEDGPARLYEAAVAAFGPPDVLVLNGPGPRPAPASAVDVTAAAEALDTLLHAHIRLVSLALPAMRERGWGRILAVGSSGIAAPLPNLALSNLGRAALAGYLKTLAAEVAPDGVTVNLLLPGRIRTERTAAVDAANAERSGRTVADVEQASAASIPAGRYGRPEEFAAAAAFLCGAPASYITGTALRCDGGLVRAL